MQFTSYAASSWPQLALASAAACLSAFVLAVSGASLSLIVLVAGAVLGSALLGIAWDYQRKRAFFAGLTACADETEHPLWVTEMVDEPDFPEGELMYRALRAVAKAANDDVASCRRQVADYREYVETWVHEAKSPLAAASLMLENLMENAPADASGEALLDKTEALGEELGRVEGYIEQALFFARSESLDRDYLIRPYDLKQLVSNVIKANARLLIGAHVAPYRKGLERTVFTDEKWMTFILGQLVQNSVKYARVEGAEIEFSAVLVDEGLAEERIDLTVRDNGCGASRADIARVFDRGFTGLNGRNSKRSTGIGLYLVKRLCDKMGLGVCADSVEGSWFAVTISFPTNKMHYFG